MGMKEDVLAHIDPYNKLPTFTREQWEPIMDRYDCGKDGENRDKWLSAIADYIIDNDIEFPKKKTIQTPELATKKFHQLCKATYNQWISDVEQDNVLEKYDDYRRPYSQYGLGVLDCHPVYNVISDYYMNDLRMQCGYHAAPSPMALWKDKEKLTRLLKFFYRTPAWQDGGGNINDKSWISMFRLGSYMATQFKPPVAKTIYHITKAKKILDTSSGWGDRLTGFYCTPHAEEYVGTDPNTAAWERYIILCENYEKLLGCTNPEITVYDKDDDIKRFTCVGKKKVVIFNLPAEDLPWQSLGTDFDCSFTSPPYFATERYAEGTESEDQQSWKKYGEYELWRDKFFIPVSEASYKALGNGGYFLCNILDPTVKGKRYYASDEMIDYMEEKYPGSFIGQIGMKFTRRANVSQKNDEEFASKCFIENVWTFRKGEKKFDLFETASLDRFFG